MSSGARTRRAVPTCIAVDGSAGEDGTELAVAQFNSVDSVAAWRHHFEHVVARRLGREELFESYDTASASRRSNRLRAAAAPEREIASATTKM